MYFVVILILLIVCLIGGEETTPQDISFKLCCPMYNISNRILQYDYYSHLMGISSHEKSSKLPSKFSMSIGVEDLVPKNYTFVELNNHNLVRILVSSKNPLLRCIKFNASQNLCSETALGLVPQSERVIQDYMFNMALFGAMDLNYCAESCTAGQSWLNALFGVVIASALLFMAIGLILWCLKRFCDVTIGYDN